METMAIIPPGRPSERPARKTLDRLAIFDETEAMKQLINLTILFCACAALALPAVAGPESLPSGKEMKQVAPAPPPECDFSWTGFYAGINGGYGWGSADTSFHPLPDAASFFDLNPVTLSPDPNGFIGGGQIGYNHQWKWLVLGIEADFQGSDMEGDTRRSPIVDINGGLNEDGTFLEAHERTQWFGTVRGRIGFAPICRLMIYATGGLAYGNVDYSANTNFTVQGGPFYRSSFTETNLGWTVGGGLEYAIGHHWSIKAEYLYYDLGDQSATALASDGRPFAVHYNWETTANIVRGGLNFKF
jgi:outer membrane immunogenic protein